MWTLMNLDWCSFRLQLCKLCNYNLCQFMWQFLVLGEILFKNDLCYTCTCLRLSKKINMFLIPSHFLFGQFCDFLFILQTFWSWYFIFKAFVSCIRNIYEVFCDPQSGWTLKQQTWKGPRQRHCTLKPGLKASKYEKFSSIFNTQI